MIYRVVIIDNKGRQATLTAKNGTRSMDIDEGMEVDAERMIWALDKLKEVKNE